MLESKVILCIINKKMNEDTLKYLKDSLFTKDADRGIYETWGDRAIDTYETVKEIYKACMNNLDKSEETFTIV